MRGGQAGAVGCGVGEATGGPGREGCEGSDGAGRDERERRSWGGAVRQRGVRQGGPAAERTEMGGRLL